VRNPRLYDQTPKAFMFAKLNRFGLLNYVIPFRGEAYTPSYLSLPLLPAASSSAILIRSQRFRASSTRD
jgi:hypothetical protein